ncbi:MAG TPA: squalene/phytoene synthase family protein [Candidatus Limnocylindria bacterium]
MTARSHPDLASRITRAASRQTYYTIRLLVDPPRRQDAMRAYAYFRWVDDVLDGCAARHGWAFGAGVPDRLHFLERQEALLDRCIAGDPPPDVTAQESMLVALVRDGDLAAWGLEAYLREMMRVMRFDVGRRGRLVSQAELEAYSAWLATAVIGAMRYFIGGERTAPTDAASYRAVVGAHTLHMLRDTAEDIATGYFNVPRELLETHGIGPADTCSQPYREWVAARVRQASADLDAGSAYFSRVPNLRHRLAGLAYISRFRWLVATIERDDFLVRSRYGDRRRMRTVIAMTGDVMAQLAGARRPAERPT